MRTGRGASDMSYRWLYAAILASAVLANSPSPIAAQTGSVVQNADVFVQLDMAIGTKDVSALATLRARGVTLSSLPPDRTGLLFHRAVRQGSGAVVEALLDMGADIEAADARGYTPLMLALEANNAEAAYALKLRGASLSKRARNGDTAEYLADILGLGGFERPASGVAPAVDLANANTMLLLAAELGNADNMRFALAAGADPAARAENGWSAMMLAALGAHEEALGLIVEALETKRPGGARADAERSLRETGMDPILAAIVGQGGAGKNHDRATKAVWYLAYAVYGKEWDEARGARYDKAAWELGYASFNAELYFNSGVGGYVIVLPDGPDYPRRPDWFLPELEYELPVGPAGDAEGWRTVQRVLQEQDRLYDGPIDGTPNEGTMKALLAYMVPLADLLVARVDEAERRAGEEKDLPQSPGKESRYGAWEETPTQGHYIGEMHFPPGGQPFPLGYVRVSGSGWPNVYEYFRPGGERDSSLCTVVMFGESRKPESAHCRLLDGEATMDHNHENLSIKFAKDNRAIASFSVPLN